MERLRSHLTIRIFLKLKGIMKHLSYIIKRVKQNHKPDFIFSLSYFFSPKKPGIALHRALFFLSCNSFLRILRNVMATFLWLSYGVWWRSYRFSRAATPAQLARYHLTRFTLLRDLLRFGLFYSLEPHQYVRLQLYKKENRPYFFQVIHDHQQAHFHRYINRHFKSHQAAVLLIGDKHRFAQQLIQSNIPTVQGIYYDAGTLRKSLDYLFQKKTVFCKPNGSAQGKDAFLLAYEDGHDRYSLKPIHGECLFERRMIERYLKQVMVRHTGFLVQPFVQNNPAIQFDASMKAPTIVRIITTKKTSRSKPTVIHLQLEIPKTGHEFYIKIPLHWESLDIDPVFQEKYPFFQKEIPLISNALKDLLRTSQAYCMDAHEHLVDLCSVAFDVIISTEGPLILEANYNWHLAPIYQVLPPAHLTTNTTHPAAEWLQSLV
jgi:hypothetical protein